MSDAIVPTPATVVLSSPGSSGPVAVTVVSDAGAAAKLMDGMLVEGQAQARAAKGLLEVVTANGVLQLRAAPGATLPAIPAGAKLTLQMIGQGDGGQLFLVGINGRALGGPGLTPNLVRLLGTGGVPHAPNQAGTIPGGGVVGGPSLGQPGQGAIASGAALAASFTPAALGSLGLTATVIRPAMPGSVPALPGQTVAGTAAGLPLDMPIGTRLTVRIAGIELSPAEGGTAATGTPPGQTNSGQSNVPARIGMAAPDGQGLTPQVTLPQGSPATMLSGTVTAQPPNGQAVVQTAVATLSVPTQGDLPVGTRLTLEVVGTPQPALPVATAVARPEGLTSQGWPALSQALDTLASANQPQALEQLLRAIPQADARLAASIAVFAGAVRAGSARALVSDATVRGLEKAGKKDVASRLSADLEALTEDAGRPVGNGDWRAYTMPMLHGGVVEPVRLFVRQPGGEEGGGRRGGGDKANDHRFVLDFNLTRLGRLQLDGLVRRDDKLFDLIIRTGEPMTSEMRLDILAIFHDASELVGTKGTVSFQAGGRWMEFPPAPPAPTRIEV